MIQNMLLNWTHEDLNLPKERMSMSSLATDDSCLKEKKIKKAFIFSFLYSVFKKYTYAQLRYFGD